MGSCCFTPKKTQFLWWYWLLLFSIVGIPMFLAALYIERRSRTEGTEKKHALRASYIFWGLTIIPCCVLCIFLIFLLTRVSDDLNPDFLNHWALIKILVVFVFCMMFATAAAKAVVKRDRPGRRIAVLLVYLFGWVLVIVGPKLLSPWGMRPFYFSVEMLPVILMEFVACMLPAHYWNRFSVSPSKKSARIFLVSLLAGTFVFWFVAQCGDVMHKHFYQLVRGKQLTKTQTTFVQDLSDAIH